MLGLHSFIHSGHFYSASSSPLLLRGAPGYSTDTIGFSRRSAQATVSKGLAQGPYVAARAEGEPTTLRLRVIDLTNATPRPTRFISFSNSFLKRKYLRSRLQMCQEYMLKIFNFHIAIKNRTPRCG